jgi:hypothetical protein
MFLVFLFASCEKEVTIDFNQEPKLCLNCILNPDSIVRARLTLSRGIETNYDFETIDNATILLFKDEELLGELNSENNGNYSLNMKPFSDSTYRIEVLHPDFSQLTASTKVPEPPSVTYSYEIIDYGQQGSIYRINAFFDIHDQKDIANYYWLAPFDTNAPFIDDFNRSLDTDSKYGYVYDYYMRISDEGYDGKVLSLNTLTIKDKTRYFWATDSHYDKYLKSSLKVQLNKEGELPFHEPVQIYSNIENGYGIFGSSATTTIEQ